MGVVLRRRLEDLDVRARDLTLAVASTRQRIAYGHEVLAQLAVINHPGHADQSSHGRKGGGVRDALANAKDIGELNAVARGELKRITGRDIKC